MRQKFARDKELHQRRRDTHPVEGEAAATSRDWVSDRAFADAWGKDEFPGHAESVQHLYESNAHEQQQRIDEFYIREDPSIPEPVKIDKSNLLLIGPTGVGKTYILE